MNPGFGWKGHSKTETVTILLRAIRFFITVSEIEYNGNYQNQYSCNYQDTMTFVSYTDCTRLISETNCPAKLLYASLTSKEHRYRSRLSSSLPEGVLQLLRNEKHLVLQEPRTLIWRTYKACLSMQLGQAYFTIP